MSGVTYYTQTPYGPRPIKGKHQNTPYTLISFLYFLKNCLINSQMSISSYIFSENSIFNIDYRSLQDTNGPKT